MPHEPSWWYRKPGLISSALVPASRLYSVIAEQRFSSAVSYRSSLPVICVGNFTAGGTGKTPCAGLIVSRLIAHGGRPVILTRGYGGRTLGPHWVDRQTDTSDDVGDEPLMLAALAPVLVARDRAGGARAIERTGAASVIVMDDGLQNPSLEKDLVIAVVDGARGLGNGCVIPAGPLRGSMTRQGSRVDAILINGEPCDGLLAVLAQSCVAPVMIGQLGPAGTVAWLNGKRVFAYAGIGHPQRFFDMVAALGAIVTGTRTFPDHARFSQNNAAGLLLQSETLKACLVTTEKDYARFAGRSDLAMLAVATTPVPVRFELSSVASDMLDRLLTKVL